MRIHSRDHCIMLKLGNRRWAMGMASVNTKIIFHFHLEIANIYFEVFSDKQKSAIECFEPSRLGFNFLSVCV